MPNYVKAPDDRPYSLAIWLSQREVYGWFELAGLPPWDEKLKIIPGTTEEQTRCVCQMISRLVWGEMRGGDAAIVAVDVLLAPEADADHFERAYGHWIVRDVLERQGARPARTKIPCARKPAPGALVELRVKGVVLIPGADWTPSSQ